MVKIDRHISDLLYDHDCVIVPEMGGFLASYAPAKLHAVQRTLSPPSKKIAFNVYLKQNDGLLAGRISQIESLSYPEALKEIKGYVGQYYKELESGRKFIVEQVGIFYMDAERNVQFEPVKNINYLKDSFGFTTIQYLSDAETHVPRSVLNRKQETRNLASRNPRLKHATMANTLLLTGSILWFCLNVYFVMPFKSNFATLNPFDTIAPNERTEEITAPVIKHQPETPSPAKVETARVNTATPENQKDSSAKLTVSSTEPEGKNIHPNYFIIAGAFRSMDNAKRLQGELKSQGFGRSGIIDSENKLILVCYGDFASFEEAYAELSKLKTQEKEAWIFCR